ncbi:MAG: hypothetical protein IKK43_00970 [Clostridia bacterium]|nr:hypothetical protein [Clostridia bacterium]
MKKNIVLVVILFFFLGCLFCLNEVNAAQYCTLHGSRSIPMIKTGSTATCTKSGVNTYTCLVCKMSWKTTTKTEKQGALGHSWSSHHVCMKCGKNMNGHWFKVSGGTYKCIVCSKTLQIESMSPNLTYKTGYRVVPYDKPSYVGSTIKITFNETPYDSNGKLMTVKGTSTRYIARNAAYHWGKDVPPKDVLKSTYPPYYFGGKEIDTKNSHVSTAIGAKTVSLATPTAGKYVYTVTVNGIQVGSQRRFVKGSTTGDDSPTQTLSSSLTIKHVDKGTGKEIVDKEYSKKVEFKGAEIIAYSLPIGENTNYQNYTNVSYKIASNEEIKSNSDSQYIVKIPNSNTDTTITFYYSVPKFNVKHIIENTNKEIVDKELTLATVAKRPSTIAFSLDVYNKYPILELTGYSIDGERKNVSSDNQYAVTVPWNGKSRDVIFYYKYSEVKINLIVKHIDIATGELMKGTSVEKYSSDKIPTAVTSLDLKKYVDYENNGVYIGGQYQKKSGTNQYNISIDVSNINYSMDYVVEFYYSNKGNNTLEYEVLDAIPEKLNADEIAKIDSNAINKEIYDVEKAIPTSENVYVNVKLYNYILKYAFDEITDITMSKVTFIQPYICNGEEKEVTTTYEIPVSAKYYKLKYLEVYKADTAEIINKVLPGEKVTLVANKDTTPTIIYEAPDTYISYNKDLTKEITLPKLEVADMKYVKTVVGSYDYAKFEAVSAAKVRNDKLIIDGQVITNNDWKENITEKPQKIIPSIMENTTLYKNGYTIDKTLSNGIYESDGSVTYKKIKNINGKSNNTITQSVKPNSVIIHTPVVNNTILDNSVALLSNQKIGQLAKNANGVVAKALVLDEEFSVKISNTGMHIDEKGYGNRTYNTSQGVNKDSYAKLKQIKFPFDVYIINGASKELIKANTWYTLALKEELYKFILSGNAKEGAYDADGKEYYIETRVIAENAMDDKKVLMAQLNANTDNKNYVAANKIFVEVIGRVYDLTITETNDPSWELEAELNVKQQPIGQAGQNNPKYKYALKLGYSVSFELKTKGKKSNEIVMSPKYFFIDKETGKVQEVDLYYHTTTKKYIKLEENTTISNVIFSDSIGAWSGEYRLPASTLAVAKGTKLPSVLTDSNEIFLKNGYILVQFNVKTNYNTWEYLGYSKPNQNTQWQKENATQTIKLPNEKEITVNEVGNFVLYEANYRSNNDYEIGGTH